MPSVTETILEARDFLQDTEESTRRYSDESLLRALNGGLRQLRRMRPDAFFDRLTDDLEPVGLEDDLPVHDQFQQALVFYIVGHSEMRDDEFTVDARASTLMTAFGRQVMTTGL